MTRRRGLEQVAKRLRRWWRWELGGLGLIVVVGLLGLAIWVLPQVIVQAELPKATKISDADRLKSINDVRGALLTALGVLAVLSGSLVAYLNFRGTLELNRRGQVTERFTKAIDQLGTPITKLDVRMGAIYALEQIAKDSPDLHWPVMQVLTTYLREQARRVMPDEDRLSRQDFLAVSDVIRRRRWQWDQEPLDFSGANLNGARFDAAQLPSACFTMARLRSADFAGAHLAEAVFDGAALEGGDFEGAQLTGADFVHAQLGRARFTEAALERADFEGAQLEGATFVRAQLYAANFRNARLEGATFSGAVLDEANFEGATGLNQPWHERLRQLVTLDENASTADESKTQD